MANRARSAEEQSGAIDLTPMLDVVFIMLIFFIVTASFVKEAGIPIAKPQAVMAEKVPNAKILVAVSNNNEIWVDKNRIEKRAIKANIERLLAENPKGAVVVQADLESNAETVALVLDAARDAGAADIKLSSEEK